MHYGKERFRCADPTGREEEIGLEKQVRIAFDDTYLDVTIGERSCLRAPVKVATGLYLGLSAESAGSAPWDVAYLHVGPPPGSTGEGGTPMTPSHYGDSAERHKWVEAPGAGSGDGEEKSKAPPPLKKPFAVPETQPPQPQQGEGHDSHYPFVRPKKPFVPEIPQPQPPQPQQGGHDSHYRPPQMRRHHRQR